MDTSARGVQAQLADRYTHTVDTQVAKTKDTGAVGDDGDLDIVRPVLNDGVQVAAVFVGEVQAFGLGVEFGPALAGFADGWGVDEWSELLRYT